MKKVISYAEVPVLKPDDFSFPDARVSTIHGIVARGGDLQPKRLLSAYQQGIFPWFSAGESIHWYSLDPRFVLLPDRLKVAKSMRPYFNQKKYEVTFDTRFREVMEACAQVPRAGQHGTWITEGMITAYHQLHQQGIAHSVEVWAGDKLVGGLYGLSLGKMFFGESMFAKASNASKFGFITLVRRLESFGFSLIDCQQPTPHLYSLGAFSVHRHEYLEAVAVNNTFPTLAGNWSKWVNHTPTQNDYKMLPVMG